MGLCEISFRGTAFSLPLSFSFSQRASLGGFQFHGDHYFNSLIEKGGRKCLFGVSSPARGWRRNSACAACRRSQVQSSALQTLQGGVLWYVPVIPALWSGGRGIGGSGPSSAGELEANLGYVRTYPKINKHIDKIDYLCSSRMATESGIGKANAMGAVTCMALGNPAGPAPFFPSDGVMVRYRFS